MNIMKLKTIGFYISISLIGMFFSQSIHGQNIEITPSYGYHFGSRLNYGPDYIEIEDSDQYGLTIGFETYDNTFAEISYVRQSTTLSIRDRVISPIESRLSDLAVDWIQVGGTQYFPNGNIRPFLGGGLGVVIFSPKNENRAIFDSMLDTTTKFTFSIKGGVNIMFSERVGLNLQGNLYIPVEWGGVYVGAGTGGISTGISLGATTIIGGFSGGFVFKLD